MNRRSIDRRRFLKLVGASALTYPFLRGLPSYAAGGSGTTDPIYLVLLFSANGCVRFDWGAQGTAPTGMTPTVTSPLVFRPTLSAFTKAGPMQADLTSQVTVLDGLCVAAAGTQSHEGGMAALWTGTTPTSANVATGPSIDQAIAPLMKSQLSVSTPYPNIPLMAQSSADYQTRDNDTRMLYDANANFVDPYANPVTALSTLFPGSMMASMSGPDKTTFIRQKVTAQVQSELTSLQSRLCTEDRQQLQNLQAVLNQVQTQMQAAATAAASCMAPSIGDAGPVMSSGGGTDPFPANVAAMSNILAMSLACDLTRVASLQLSHALSPVTHTWLGSSQTQTHHIYSHQGPSWIGQLGADPYNNPQAMSLYPQQLIDIDAWYAEQVASLAYTLSQLKTVSGKSLLDQTVICWGSELDMGAAHNHNDTPFVLIGGGGGKLKTNQLVRFYQVWGNQAQNNMYTGERAHNDLLLTLAQVMGVNVGTTFGTASFCTGPITQLLA